MHRGPAPRRPTDAYDAPTVVREAPPEVLDAIRADRFESGEREISIPRPPPVPQFEGPLPRILWDDEEVQEDNETAILIDDEMILSVTIPPEEHPQSARPTASLRWLVLAAEAVLLFLLLALAHGC